MSKDKDFQSLLDDLLFTYRQFCLNEVIHEKVGDDFYYKFTLTWNVVLISLERDYLIGLARIFDTPKEFDKTISIYYFFNHDFAKHYETISKIKNLRNRFLAHIDLKTKRAPEEFLRKNHIERSEISSLLDTTVEVISRLGKSLGLGQNLKQLFDQAREETRNRFDEWFKVFQKGYVK